MLTFSQSPFNLAINDTIVVRVKAVNDLGSAVNYSPLNTGVVTVKTNPLSPATVPEIGPSTTESQIEIVIAAIDADLTGESDILTYDIYWDNGSGQSYWMLLETITNTGSSTFSYLQSTGVAEGGTYYFKYRANNLYGEGEFSSVGGIKASNTPVQMDQPVLTEVDLDVNITWIEPADRGDPITSYRVTIYNNNDLTYEEHTDLCDGAAAVNSLT